jgi:hypothetical protein
MNVSFSEYMEALLDVPTKIDFYACVILHSIGLLLHLFSLYIYQKPSMNKTNMGYLFTCQSCVDAAYLFFLIVNVQPPINKHFSHSDHLCKLSNFAVSYLYNLSPWTNAFICMERFLFVLFPRSCQLIKSKRNLTALFIVMFALIALASGGYFASFIRVNRIRWNNRTERLYDCTVDLNLARMFSIINPLMRPILPTFLIVLMNILMLSRIKQNKRRCVNSKEKAFSRKEKRFTLVVVAMSVTFVLFNLPSLAISIYNLVFIANGRVSSPVAWSNYLRFSTTITHFSIMYQSGYFFVLLASNNIFRGEALRLFGITTQSGLNEPLSRTSKWTAKTKIRH